MKTSLFNAVVNLSLLLPLLSGCQQQTSKNQTNGRKIMEQKLRLNNAGDLESLHPHTGLDLNCRIFQTALFEPLVRHGEGGAHILAGAEKIAISEDRLTYTITLRDQKWTNGEKVTAADYEKTWKAALDPRGKCLRSDLFYVIKNAKLAKEGKVPAENVGVHANDDKTLIVELDHPAPFFLDLLANPIYLPLYSLEEKQTVFNGPFCIEKYDHEEKLVLKKNLSYWDQGNVSLDQIELSFVKDPNTALLMYEKGQLDWIGSPFTILPFDSITHLQSSKAYVSKSISAVYWLCLNVESFPLNSKKIRKALSIALNRDDISTYVVVGETPTRTVTPTGISLLNSQDLYKDGDIETAQKLFEEGLQELGITRKEFPTIELSHSNIAGQKKLAEALQERWEKIFGIKFALRGSEWNVFFSNLATHEYQIGGCIWFSIVNDPIYNLEFFKYKTNRYNSASFENPYYQKLLDLADQEVDPEIRREHLRQAELLLLDEMPVIPLYVNNCKYLISPKVEGAYLNHMGMVDLKNIRVLDKAVIR